MTIYEKYETVIGLEVHAQLLTKSKAYSYDAATYGGLPNSNVSVVSIGHPGTLPKANKKDPALEVKMMAAAKSAIAQAGWKNEALKVIIKSNDWEIIKNEYTHKIIKRRIYAFIASKKEGSCLYQLFTFCQDYTGSGYQDKTYVCDLPVQDFNIHCDCLKGK